VRTRVDIVNRGSEIELLLGHGVLGQVYQARSHSSPSQGDTRGREQFKPQK
jgi:hypothetical protein